MNSAPLKSLQEFLKLLFLDKLLPQAQMIFYLESAQGILNLPADTNSFLDGARDPIHHACRPPLVSWLSEGYHRSIDVKISIISLGRQIKDSPL